ncbi:MAG: PIN domain-containing protein [DPANN group archaeon]|nr:PIN domain-containing protein [DPANN group archaeon]
MKFVVDTNIILSALIKDSVTRKILADLNFEFFAPSFSLTEIMKYQEYICKKTLMTPRQFGNLLQTIFENIEIIPGDFYKNYLDEANELMKKIDLDDVPFLACAMVLNLEIWSDDKHFKQQDKIKVFTTSELIERFS